MHRKSLIAVACLVLGTGVRAQEVIREQPVTLQLDIDAHGQVTTAKPMDPLPVLIPNGGGLISRRSMYAPLPPVLAQAAIQVASHWRFKPFVVAGQPATGRTWANATLQIVKRPDGKFGVTLRYDRNGPYMTTAVAPEYPNVSIRRYKSGAIVMEYTAEASGDIDNMRVFKVLGDAVDHSSAFEGAVRKALSKSRSMPLLVNGKAIATRVRTPFIFTVTPDPEADRLEQQIKEVMPSEGADVSAKTSASGEAVAVDSPFEKQPRS